jgi:hypothetical protein
MFGTPLPSHRPHTSSARTGRSLVVILLIAAGVYLAANIGIYLYSSRANGTDPLAKLHLGGLSFARPTPTMPVATPFPTPTPLPRPLLSRGVVTFTTSSSGNKEPVFQGGSFGPVDAKNGQNQTYTINLKSSVPVTEITATLKTDHGQKTYPLTRSKGNDTDGGWTATWTLGDSYDYVYQISVTAKNSSQMSNTNDLTFK